jgi:bleomycin hydrolase
MGVELTQQQVITDALIDRFKTDFQRDPVRKVIMNAIKKNGINAVAMNQESPVNLPFTFSHEIQTGKITNQKQSGRCWMFAGLNTLRLRVMERCHLETFELSQNYLMFWDKFEKANYFLESILETLDEPTDGRLIAWLLRAPVQDGGQWDMFVNLVEKYGVVPKDVMPETFESSKTQRMNRLLTMKLRKSAAEWRKAYQEEHVAVEDLRSRKEAILNEVYRILCQSLGEPPTLFDFEYRDKDYHFYRDARLTPQAFYQKYVGVALQDYVSVINAPTTDKPFGKTYTVKYLGNVKGGKDVLYLNVEMDVFKELTLKQLLDNEPVWFGCDVGQMMDRDTGIMDLMLFDFENTLNVSLGMTKAERLEYGDSLMTHAMVFTGVHLVEGEPLRWKVENSWGEDRGNKGFFVMSDAWFDEYMYQVVIHKKYLPDTLKAALDQEPIALEPWDPMGSLA